MNAVSAKDSQRFLALWFPYLATDRLWRQRRGRSWRLEPGLPVGAPLVISHRENNTQRIAALDEQAESLGLVCGMGIADARAMHPHIEVRESEPVADGRLLTALADWCDRYTPLVALDAPGALFLDISGCAHLFGGEKRMLEDILSGFFHQGFSARAGLASTPGAAWAAARLSGAKIIDPGDEAAFLTPLPLSALRLAVQTRLGLESVGLRSVGAIIDAPRAPLVRRFGRELILRMDQALGHIEEPVTPRLPVAPLSVERRLADPVTTLEEIGHLTGLLATTLKGELDRRGEGARRLEMALFRVDGAVKRIVTTASRPVNKPVLIERLLRERFAAVKDTIDPGYGFDLLRLSATVTSPVKASQRDLNGDDEDAHENLSAFADRARARLGDGIIWKPCLRQSHIPERAGAAEPLFGLPVKKVVEDITPDFSAERPIRLFAYPEPVEVMAEIPDGPPARFRWRKVHYQISRAEGPERLAPEWWRGDSDMETRDYFRVEDNTGHRYWLYRQGLYGVSDRLPRWFMHGIFA